MKHILIVDDNKNNLVMAKQELSDEYQVTPVISGEQALKFLEKKSTDLILLDINMPDIDGKETMRRIRENPEWAGIPIIFLTADSSPETEAECLSAGADDFIAKPFVPQVMKSRISRILELHDLRNDLESKLEEKSRQLESVTIDMIMAIAKMLEAKDYYTSGHSDRVAMCSAAIARKLDWDEQRVQNLYHIGLLHDIGKVGVPDVILNKPMFLLEDEFAVLKKHSTTGAEILKGIYSIENIQYGVLYHHERYDGKGYPKGISGEEIPIEARIIAIADSYDAMTTDRVYRKRLTDEKVMEELVKGRGTQFDPELTDIFIEMLNAGFTLYSESEVRND